MAYKDLTNSKHDRMLSKALATITMMIKTRELTIEDTYKLFEDIAENPMIDETIAQTIEILNIGKKREGKTDDLKIGNCIKPDISVSAELNEPQHCCGLMGFNPMLGDTCPACEAER